MNESTILNVSCVSSINDMLVTQICVNWPVTRGTKWYVNDHYFYEHDVKYHYIPTVDSTVYYCIKKINPQGVLSSKRSTKCN